MKSNCTVLTTDPFLAMTLPWMMFAVTVMVFLISIWRFYVVVFSRYSNLYPIVSKAIHSLLPLALGVLSAHKLYQQLNNITNRPTSCQITVEEVSLGGFPGYLYLCTFLFLVTFWAVRYYRDSQAADTVKTAYIALVVTVISVWLLFFILLSIYADSRETFLWIHEVEVGFASIVQLMGSVAYLYFWSKLYVRVPSNSSSSPGVKKMHKKIGILTIFETTIMSLRAIYLLVMTFLDLTSESFAIVFTIFSVLFDLMPPLVVMGLLGQTLSRTMGANLLDKATLDSESDRQKLYASIGREGVE